MLQSWLSFFGEAAHKDAPLQAVLMSCMFCCAATLCVCSAEGSYDGDDDGQGEFDSFVEPSGLILSSFIEKRLTEFGGEMQCG